MKIKECIKLGVEPCDGEIPPISMPYFLMNMACILAMAASDLAAEDFPTLAFRMDSYGGGKGIENNVLPAARVLCGVDWLRNAALFRQTYGFFKWLIEQENPGDENMWYDHDFLGKKWNEYAEMEEAKK